MTIGAWAVVVVLALCGLAVAVFCGIAAWACPTRRGKIGLAVALVAVLLLTAAICGAFMWYRNNSESGRRALRDQESNLGGGIERTVSVYDVNGNLIKEYSGRFDIETDHTNYILFDDADGVRHMIYFTTGTIIIDEQ